MACRRDLLVDFQNFHTLFTALKPATLSVLLIVGLSLLTELILRLSEPQAHAPDAQTPPTKGLGVAQRDKLLILRQRRQPATLNLTGWRGFASGVSTRARLKR